MKQLQLIATETLANLTQFRKARNTFRRHGGIPRLVDLLDVDTSKVGFWQKKLRFTVESVKDLNFSYFLYLLPKCSRELGKIGYIFGEKNLLKSKLSENANNNSCCPGIILL